MISFTVPGNPVPWQRAQSRGGQRFTAPETRAYQRKVVDAALSAGVVPHGGPLRLTLRFFRGSGHACDLDNLTKTVGDALNGIAYADDRQIVELRASKGVDREHPRAEVEIEATEFTVSASASNALEGLKRLGTPKRRPRLSSSKRDFRDVAKGGRS